MNKAIFYTHHKNDDFTRWNFFNIKNLNPLWDVIPVGFENFDLLEGSLKVNTSKYPTNNNLIKRYSQYNISWSESDLLFYDSYFQRPDYQKYFFIEWDCVSNVSVDEFFPTNTFDVFGNNSFYCNLKDKWEFVEEYIKWGGEITELASYGQSCCVFFKRNVLKQISEELIANKDLYNDMFSELRGGTLIIKFNKLVQPREDIREFIWWEKNGLKFKSKKYFYHPIKSFQELREVV